MGLKQEELISRYFEHKMTPGEEQNFLISLAASDQMRIAFRSHLELMKAVREDKDDLRSVAQVRTRTLTALGISAAAVTPFIEQELLKGSADKATTPAVRSTQSAPWYSKVSDILRTRKFALGTGLMLGFSTATLLVNVSSDHQATDSPRVVTAPSVVPQATPQTQPAAVSQEQPEVSGITPLQTSAVETNEASKGLNTTARPSTSTSSSLSNSPRSTGAAHVTSSIAQSTKTNTTPPVVNASKKGHIDVKPIKISSPNDTGGAK